MSASIYVGATCTPQGINVWADSLNLGDSEPAIGSLIRTVRTFVLDECEVICRPRAASRKHMCVLPEDAEVHWRRCTTALDFWYPPVELAGFGMNRVATHTFGTQVFHAYSVAISTTKVGETIALSVVRYSDLRAQGMHVDTFPDRAHIREALRRAVEAFVHRLCRLGTSSCKPGGTWQVIPAEQYRNRAECRRAAVWFRSVARQRGLPVHVVNACTDLLLQKNQHWSVDQCWVAGTLAMVVEEQVM